MTYATQPKPQTGPCESQDHIPRKDDQSPETFKKCTYQGVRRYDHTLDSGIHCDAHWQDLLDDCGKQSW